MPSQGEDSQCQHHGRGAERISITTTARTDAEGLSLLKSMGMPFRQQ